MQGINADQVESLLNLRKTRQYRKAMDIDRCWVSTDDRKAPVSTVSLMVRRLAVLR